MSSEHIVKSYDEELNHLNENILKMGGLAEALLASAIESICVPSSLLTLTIAKKPSACVCATTSCKISFICFSPLLV